MFPAIPCSLTPQICEAVHQVLRLMAVEHMPLDKAYAQQFQTGAYNDNEHAAIALISGSIVRKLNLYGFLANVDLAELSSRFNFVLWAWCQLHHCKPPAFLKVNEQDTQSFHRLWEKAQTLPTLLDGCPAWLEQCGLEQLGEQWPRERAALASAPKRYIRVNTLKASLAELQLALKKDGIETQTVSGVDSALEVLSDCALFKTSAFHLGYFEQQDAGSQLIIQALDVKPGHRVIDACSGAGGKTLGIAAAMQGKGRLLALDVDEYKLVNLKKRAKRAGADNIEIRHISSSKIIKRQKESADRLLLDVPCSGLGVLKRNPDGKWHRDISKSLPDLLLLQQDILTRYSKMLKPKGIMVYSTCSILPLENQQQVHRFLALHPNFKCLAEANISPAETGFDGFYWAKLERDS
jgi:16S rRNA (cytosine967-C5)-methyltransferase